MEASEETSRTVADVVCTNCCCLCDDIRLDVNAGAITSVAGACELGRKWFLSSGRHTAQTNCRVGEQAVSLDEAMEVSGRLLRDARYPLIYGLTHVSSEAQRAATELADRFNAVIDTATSSSHGPSIMGFQSKGKVTCSLGETRNRADFIIFWGTDVVREHPRFYTDYSAEATGMLVPRGRANRQVVVINTEESATSDRADRFYQIKPHSDYEVLLTLRALVRDVPLDGERVEDQTGVPLTAWTDLVSQMKHCRFGSIAFGLGLMQSRGRHANTEALFGLIADMNKHTRFVCRSIRRRGNVTGADKVLTWRTGYPFAVNFARGYPRYQPGEYSASEVLARGEVDLALVVASDPMSDLPDAARQNLAAIPYIYIGPHDSETSRRAHVTIPTAVYGIHTPGTAYRTDDIPFALRPVKESALPSESEVLRAIGEAASA
ncbi:MAG: formylmethanofuran dehydrogenase subunit B [Pirellulales bacterium]|nr:formylmethanofuran dehydrogenase subunit B [Pirellulales bacterium]